jgi:Sec-independent protein translocase protein TatA
MERLLAAVDRWGRAIEATRSAASTDADAADRELKAAEDQLLGAYHEIPRRGS